MRPRAELPEHAGVAVLDGEPGDDSGAVSHRDLRTDAFGLRRLAPAGAHVVLGAPHARTVAAAVLALDVWAGRVEQRGADLPLDDPPGAVVLDDSATRTAAGRPPATPGSDPTRWVLYTSGTTGEPKPVEHTSPR